VSTPDRRARAEREVVRQCHLGLDVTALQHAVLASLRRLMPVDAAFFATADPGTWLFTGAYTEEPLRAVTSLFLANEFGAADLNRFSSLARSAPRAASLDAATHGQRLASARYREILRPLGLGDELRAALVTDSECWGFLCLHRTDSGFGFTAAETSAIARLAPHIAHGLRHAVLAYLPTPGGAAAGPGVVLLTETLEVVAITPEAEHLLALTGQQPPGTRLPIPVLTAAVALRSAADNPRSPHPTPRGRVPLTSGGWLDVHASWLRGRPGQARITIVLQPASTGETVPLLLSAYGLTPREAQIAKLVLRGSSTREIVDSLHISHYTVQDHLKAVFDKVGVRSRRDLAGTLLGQRPPRPTGAAAHRVQSSHAAGSTPTGSTGQGRPRPDRPG
jgi:DNA-binding CsgD family transcriptional regulator